MLGLTKFGKGDWRSISRNFVVSRTPTQVASHAQKYFIRLNSMNKKDKRRSSIHDITSVAGAGSGNGAGAVGNSRGRGGAIQSALTSSGDASAILALVAERASAFDAIHAATAIHRVATHVAKDRRGGVEDPKTRAKEEALMNSDAFRTLQTLVLANLPKMNAQGLANVAWAFAKMERDPGADALAAIAAGLAAELGKNAKPRANDGGRRSSRPPRRS